MYIILISLTFALSCHFALSESCDIHTLISFAYTYHRSRHTSYILTCIIHPNMHHSFHDIFLLSEEILKIKF